MQQNLQKTIEATVARHLNATKALTRAELMALIPQELKAVHPGNRIGSKLDKLLFDAHRDGTLLRVEAEGGKYGYLKLANGEGAPKAAPEAAGAADLVETGGEGLPAVTAADHSADATKMIQTFNSAEFGDYIKETLSTSTQPEKRDMAGDPLDVIEEVTRFRTADGNEFETLEDAHAAVAFLKRAAKVDEFLRVSEEPQPDHVRGAILMFLDWQDRQAA